MSKQHKIRWTEADSKELARVVRNYNAKIKRLGDKNPRIKNILPETTSVRKMKELINTRQDLKRELNSLQRFSKRGAEEIVTVPGTDYNLKITKWQKAEMNRRIGVINRRRKKRLEDIRQTPMTSRGEELGYTVGDIGMGKASEVSLKPMNAFTRRMSQNDLKWKWQGILHESQSDYFTRRDYLLRENYIKGLEQNYQSRDIKEVVAAIENMDIKEFLNIFNAEGGRFEWIYYPDIESYKAYLSALKAQWTPNK